MNRYDYKHRPQFVDEAYMEQHGIFGKSDTIVNSHARLAMIYRSFQGWLAEREQEHKTLFPTFVTTETTNEAGEVVTITEPNPEYVEFEKWMVEPDETGELIRYVDIQEPDIAQWRTDNYAPLRKAAYGSWENQLEMQTDGTWNEHVAAVKVKYPKV